MVKHTESPQPTHLGSEGVHLVQDAIQLDDGVATREIISLWPIGQESVVVTGGHQPGSFSTIFHTSTMSAGVMVYTATQSMRLTV